eukprot:COSAG01_NODE_72437_length_253_cov_0.616883_1_plen_63_part_01
MVAAAARWLGYIRRSIVTEPAAVAVGGAGRPWLHVRVRLCACSQVDDSASTEDDFASWKRQMW